MNETGPAGSFTFGEIVPEDDADAVFEAAVTEDGRAFTLTFSDLVSTVDGPDSMPVSASMFSVVLPLHGEGKAEIEFGFSGAAIVTPGATATLFVSASGQSTVRDFPPGTDDSFVHPLQFFAEGPSECRLFALLVAGRDSVFAADAEPAAFINILSIDGEMLPRPAPPEEPEGDGP